MIEETDRSPVTRWLRSLEAGDAEAADKLCRHYFEDLVRHARARLRNAPWAVSDEEDAALSAFDSFCRGATRGCYPRLHDRKDLWRLLVVITERKAIDQTQRERRQKRDGGKVLGMPDGTVADTMKGAVERAECPEPTPEFAAMVSDECRRLFAMLRDESLREVARLKMEGYTSEEVAERLGCSPRSVARKLELIRRTWLAEAGVGP